MPGEIRDGTLQNGAWIKKIPSSYEPAQVRSWLERMGLDLGTSSDSFPPPSRKTLNAIVKRHLIMFPFENTDMHYTPHHSMDVSAEAVYNRLVKEYRGGSYCFGLNGLILGMLRGLGYRAFAGSARVNHGPPDGPLAYTSLNHQVIFVQPENDSNQTYLVDVGFGTGLVRPILLSNSEENIVMGTDATEHHRLIWAAAHSTSLEMSNGSTTPGAMKWNPQVLHGDRDAENAAPWRILYSFSEEEFHDRDFHDASFVVYSSPNPNGLFWNNVVCIKYFADDDADANSDGDVSREIAYRMTLMGKEVKKRGKGGSETILKFDSEVERVRALRDIFGVKVLEEDARNIIGRVPALE
ncbi:cysteine proteinase [Pholiota conissans]|uniref:Cysteine proteinase n=1 Tax=Pholiota conissans TaxID=109636 RepID=A0A9P5YXY9_9AGAR|nr:cysteine proteinase [Pholiota conissans]